MPSAANTYGASSAKETGETPYERPLRGQRVTGDQDSPASWVT